MLVSWKEGPEEEPEKLCEPNMVVGDDCSTEDGGIPWPLGLPGLPLLGVPEGCPGRVTVIVGSGRVPSRPPLEAVPVSLLVGREERLEEEPEGT